MKKIILGFLLLAGLANANNAAAQLSIPKDTVYGYAGDAGLELHNNVTNTATTSATFTWRIFYNNVPAASSKWNTSFGLCDNKQCYDNGVLAGISKTTDAIPANGVCDFHVAYGELSGVTTYGPYYVSVELTQGLVKDTTTFVISKFPTSVGGVTKNSDNILLYPNPAHNELNVVFDGMQDIKTIGVYNLIGKLVSIYKVTGTSAKLDIDNIPSGIYFIRLADAQGHVEATRKFTHQ